MEENGQPGPLELRLMERFDELLATPEGRAQFNTTFSELITTVQKLDLVWAADERPPVSIEVKGTDERTCRRLWRAAWGLRHAKTSSERRKYVREFLSALAESSAQLLQTLARVLLVLLSRLLGCNATFDIPEWKPVPLDTAPQIAPRGPNFAFPVSNHRGGHYRSTLGSVVLAA